MTFGEILEREGEIANLAQKIFVAAFAAEHGASVEAAFKAAEQFIHIKNVRFDRVRGINHGEET